MVPLKRLIDMPLSSYDIFVPLKRLIDMPLSSYDILSFQRVLEGHNSSSK